jgi:outer membrane immunogenic protein
MLVRLSLLSGLLCATPFAHADAADLLRPYGPPPLPPVFSWTGFYVGIHAGGEFGDTSFSDPFSGFSNNPRIAGFEGGGQVGYDYQMGAVVIGAEADISAITLIGNATDAGGFDRRTKGQWLSTVTGRLGVAADRWLFFGKGGVAFASLSDSVTDPNLNVESTGFQTQAGWIAGVGIEYAFEFNWTARLEYDFIGFGSRNVTFNGPLGTVTSPVDVNFQRVTGAINYRF